MWNLRTVLFFLFAMRLRFFCMAENGLNSTLAPPTSCDAHYNCAECGADSHCQWCGQAATVEVKAIILKVSTTPKLMGVCRPAEAKCDDIVFGGFDETAATMQSFIKQNAEYVASVLKPYIPAEIPGLPFNITEEFLASLLKSFTLTPSVKKIEPKDSFCSQINFPKGMDQPNCKSCLELGNDYGYCSAEIKALLLEPSVIATMCLPKDLGWLCDANILPELPFLSDFTIKAAFATEAQQCEGGLPLPPKGQPACGLSESCYSCGLTSSTECTWCGGQMTIQGEEGEQDIALFGKCVDGHDASCDGLTWGTVGYAINHQSNGSTTYEVNRQSFGDQQCSNVHWPKEALEPDCNHCVNKQDGWCQLAYDGTQKENLFSVPVKIGRFKETVFDVPMPEQLKFKSDVGTCLDPAANWMCMSIDELLTSKFYTKAIESECPTPPGNIPEVLSTIPGGSTL